MRIHPKVVVRRNVRNQSARNVSKPDLIVLHSTESPNRPGNADLASIGEWFDNPQAQASSHVCTDGEGHSARYVPDSRKAWAQVAFNSRALSIEQIGRAAQHDWPKAQLEETARWVARWSKKYGIPIRHSPGGSRSGVARHSDLGQAGGGHSDPGVRYPLNEVLELARGFKRRLS